MNAINKLNEYLQAYSARLRSASAFSGAAATFGIFLIALWLAAYVVILNGFDTSLVWYARLALVLILVASITGLLIFPLKRLKSYLAKKIEDTSPDFDGRIQTFLSSQAASDDNTPQNPMLGLLAEDALNVAEKNAPSTAVKSWQIYLPIACIGAIAIAFLWTLIAAPGLINYSARHILAGWMVDDLLPPQTIVVSPGDDLVRRGASLTLRADASGFQPNNADLFVRIGDDDWQQVSMTEIPVSEIAAVKNSPIELSEHEKIGIEESLPLNDTTNLTRSFDFTLFSVREPVSYYAVAGGVRSPNYRIDVIDLPGIKNLELTYNYPEWTGLESETKNIGGDIDALAGTSIDLKISTNSPLPAGELVLNGEVIDMTLDGETGEASFDIDQDGEYYLAARIGNEQVRLSDNYFIRVMEDEKPEIEFSSPGRDWNATNIEEVATSIRVEEDYSLTNVELRYAVNGGAWQSISLPTSEPTADLEHMFFLETLEAIETIESFEQIEILDALGAGETTLDQEDITEQKIIEERAVALAPGDLISYYAVAEDRQSQTQTDMYFIEIQPFDRRFSRAEQGQGGGQGEQGGQEQEISQRQKEIILSTWNLIREQADQSRSASDSEQRILDNAKLLAGLQLSLQEQAQSLVETARSRGIDGDERVGTFVAHMENAIASMTPASEMLAAIALETAIQPEQEALRHLLAADAVFNDIQVSLNQGGQAGAGGGGGSAGQDLAEMLELEIDFKQNQYETGSQASRESLQQETDDAMRELEELARRQEQLAESVSRAQQPTEAQKWQQEMLRRDAEELRERLERIEQDQSNAGQASNQQAQSGQQGQESQQGQQGQSTSGNQQAGQGSTEQTASAEQSELNRRLESALDAMDRASEAMQNGDSDQLQQAAGEAQRQLEGAGSQIAEDQEADIQRAFTDMANRAESMHRSQEQLEQELLDGVAKAVQAAPEGATSVMNPFEWEREQEMAETKREMIAELQRLKEDMQLNANRVRSEQPDVARIIEQADEDIKESEIAIRMDIAADYMSQGESLYVANSESLVTRGLDELSEALQEAARAVANGGGEQSGLDELLSRLREGGSALRELAENANETSGQSGNTTGAENGDEGGSGDPGQAEPASGEQQGSSDQAGQSGPSGQAGQDGRQGGSPTDQGQQAGNPGGQAGGRRATGQGAQDPNTAWYGWGNAPDARIGDAETQLGDFTAGIGGLVPELRARGVEEDQIAEVNRLVRQIQNAALGDGIENRSELNQALALLEQLEQTVEKGLSSDSGKVRSASPDRIQLEYKDAVAEYYRLLSDDTATESEDGGSVLK